MEPSWTEPAQDRWVLIRGSLMANAEREQRRSAHRELERGGIGARTTGMMMIVKGKRSWCGGPRRVKTERGQKSRTAVSEDGV